MSTYKLEQRRLSVLYAPSAGLSRNHADSAVALLEALGLGAVEVVVAQTWVKRGLRAGKPVQVSSHHTNTPTINVSSFG